MDSISYLCISWIIKDMWTTYTTFEGGDPMFSNTIAEILVERTAVQQCQLRVKWLLRSTTFIAFVSSLKLSRRLLCSVRFVFVSTFNLHLKTSLWVQSNVIYNIFFTSSNFEIYIYEIESIFLNHAVFQFWISSREETKEDVMVKIRVTDKRQLQNYG